MRAGIEAQGQLQHVLEEHRAHRRVLAMRKPVGVERDQRAADDGEERKADPGADQCHQVRYRQLGDLALRVRERIDDAPEQDRLHECRARKRKVGEGEEPAQAGFVSEQSQHADVEADELHAIDTGAP